MYIRFFASFCYFLQSNLSASYVTGGSCKLKRSSKVFKD